MDKGEIAAQIKAFFEEEFRDPDRELTESTNLLEEWFVDSLGIVDTVLFLESNFAIEISRADVNGTIFENVSTLTQMVAQRLAAKTTAL